ncbi:ABC-2 family transporter protein [Micromonospora sp. NPDC000089]|uniref:ABC-2 family transporter protein n=1 Tax=unclassified Micromonospora TaxID=2617518 RepID=UPI003689240E
MLTKLRDHRSTTIAEILFRQAYAYPGRFTANLVGAAFPLIMMIVWSTLPPADGDATLQRSQIIAYFGAAALCSAATSSRATWKWDRTIRGGTLEDYLLVPLGPFSRIMVSDLCERVIAVLTLLPVFLALRFQGGSSWNTTQFLAGLLLLPVAYVVSCQMNSIIGMLAAYVHRVRRIHEVFWGAGGLLSGLAAPPQFFPDWLQHVAQLSPYPILVGIPASLLSGTGGHLAVAPVVASVTVWTVLVTTVQVLLWRRLRQTPGGVVH